MVDRRTFAELERARVGIAALPPPVAPSYRPLQGLKPNQMGQSIMFLPPDPGLGGTYTFPFTQTKTLFDARTPAEEAEMCTVMVEAIVVNTDLKSAGIFFPRLVGIIKWGIGGANYQSQFDLGNGCTFSLLCNWVRVDVMYTIDGGNVPFIPIHAAQYLISGSVGYGNYSPSSNGARLTVEGGGVVAGGTVTVDIPPFANAFTLIAQNNGLSPVTDLPSFDVIVDDHINVISRYLWSGFTTTTSQRENTIPLPGAPAVAGFGNPSRLILTNLGIVAPDNNCSVGVIFNLCF